MKVSLSLYFFTKKTKEKFKRFNDNIINKLNQNPDINILSVIIPLGNYLENGITYYYNTKRDQEINYIKNQNKIFNRKHKPDFTKVLPIDVFVVEELRHIARFEPANRNPDEIYNLINQDKSGFPFIDNKYIDENNRDSSHYKFSPSIGLGVLDILEYYPTLDY